MATGEPDYRYGNEASQVLQNVPVPLRTAAAWSWRLIVIGIVLLALLSMLAKLAGLVVPLIIALIIAAPLSSLVTSLERRGVPRGLASISVVLALLTSIITLAVLAGQNFISSLDSLRAKAGEGLRSLISWLSEGPLNIDAEQANAYLDNLGETIRENSSTIISGALSVTGTVGLLVAGVILALFGLFFFLKDGRQIWEWVIGHFPESVRPSIDYAGGRSWDTLGRYARTSVFVSFVDAVGIGLGAWIIGVPLALPIAILVFLTAFIPMVGALLSGLVAVMVAFLQGGWVMALLMLGVVVLVQQLEGSVLYPWLFGKAVSVHPLAILLSISIGATFAGIAGALLAVPTLAVFKSFVDGLRRSGVGPTQAIPTVTADQARDRKARAARKG